MINLFILQICIEKLSFASFVLSTGGRGCSGDKERQVPDLMELAILKMREEESDYRQTYLCCDGNTRVRLWNALGQWI